MGARRIAGSVVALAILFAGATARARLQTPCERNGDGPAEAMFCMAWATAAIAALAAPDYTMVAGGDQVHHGMRWELPLQFGRQYRHDAAISAGYLPGPGLWSGRAAYHLRITSLPWPPSPPPSARDWINRGRVHFYVGAGGFAQQAGGRGLGGELKVRWGSVELGGLFVVLAADRDLAKDRTLFGLTAGLEVPLLFF